MRRRGRMFQPVSEMLGDRCLLSQMFGYLPSGLTPAQLTQAYGLENITFQTANGSVSGNGAGQTIALIEAYHDPTIASDLETFDATYGLPNPSFQQINLGGDVVNPGWGLEESLDVEWAHAIAPAANIIVVEAASQSRGNLMDAVDVARRTPSVSVISMSFGFSEASYEGSSHFQTPAGHQGITFLAASGDNSPSAGADWPSVSPDVVSVGGTSLYTDESGDYQYETPWVDSGGGDSQYMAEPAYQRSAQVTGRRSTPDVALDGDPNTGVEVYETSTYSGYGSWQIVGGTSLATPGWAAIIAIADQGRVLAGGSTLNGATQTLPALYSLPSSDFHQIYGAAEAGGNQYVSGENIQTGLGSPIGSLVIADLVASTINEPLTTSRGSGLESARQIAKSHRQLRKISIHTDVTSHSSSVNARPAVLDGLRRGQTILGILDDGKMHHRHRQNR
jgi:subtilase family serine protease